MKAIKYLISILFILSTNIVCGQDELEIKLDSIEELVNSETFNEDYKPILQYLKTIQSDCMNSTSKLTKARFLNHYGAALYYTEDYKNCVPVLKNYLKFVEDDQINDMAREENFSVYEALGRSQFMIGDIDGAYSTTRRAIVYFDDELNKNPSGYQILSLLSQICEAKGDSILLDEAHHATQTCFLEYWNYIDPSSSNAKEVKAAYDMYTQKIALHNDKYYEYRKIRANLLKNIAFFDEAEYEYNKLIRDMELQSVDNKNLLQDVYLGLFQLYKETNAVEKAKRNIAIVKSYFRGYHDKESSSVFAYVLNYYAMLLDNNSIKDFNEASDAYEEAIKICGADSVVYIFKNNYAALLNHKGVNYILNNDTKNAKIYLDKAETLCTDEVTLETIKHNSGRVEMLNGNYAKALILLKESADMQLRTKGEVMELTTKYINECNSKL